ncbi:MAG: putative transcriptional regulatory protein YebC [Candidatus Celerinatantimonas neptuna]|nr:MAG: putative transcriptional regulatory protein YebC [Candidatus Celerinatantimonas neptuna]
MAGHSKWANIKHRKAAQDSKRGKVFTKLIRELTVSAREGGSDADSNPRLRAAIDKALSNNMTRDTVERAIKRGAGELDGQELETVIYEGYGPGGTAVMVECMTDNRNRTAGSVRHAFSKSGGNLGTDGSVAYLFDKKGVINYSPDLDEETVMDVALEAGAEDIITNEDGSIDVYTSPDDFGVVKDALDLANFEAENAEVTMIPSTSAELDEQTAQKLMRLIDMLEDDDDVQEVYHNAEISDEVMEKLG